jgi:enoyl-CoA hydratase/carnithine racemase
MAMYRGLGTALHYVRDDEELQALIVTGVDDVFITGGDIGDHEADLDDGGLPFEMMQRGTVPIVAAVNGHCLASGVLLMVLSDVSVVSDRAKFRLPELRLGVAAPWSAALLPGVVGMAVAKDLALTGRQFDAEEARAIGLAGRVVAHAALRDEARSVAMDLLEAGPEARLAWKRAAHAGFPAVTASAVLASIATEEAAEGFAAFAEHRPPRWSPRRAKHSRNTREEET